MCSALHIQTCDTIHVKEAPSMPTNLAIDDRLIEEARQIGNHVTKKEAVTAALDEYIRRRKQMQVLDLFDTIDYHEGYDYRANRRRDRSKANGETARRYLCLVARSPSPAQRQPQSRRTEAQGGIDSGHSGRSSGDAWASPPGA